MEVGIQSTVQQLLGQEVTQCSLMASGACNDAYYVETSQGSKYIVKRAKDHRDIEELNSLPVEGRLIQALEKLGFSVPLPRVVFVSEDPAMYGYEYIDGEPLIRVWPNLTEAERISICSALGQFHAELGQKVSKVDAVRLKLTIDESVGLHPEVAKEYTAILASDDVPSDWQDLARLVRALFDQTLTQTVFQCIHNDAHHENVLVADKQIVGFIDFGDAQYGEVAKEFSRYIRDFPQHFQHIVAAYEEASGHRLSRDRLLSNAFLSGFMENVEDYRQGGAARQQAETAVATYQQLLRS